MNATLINHFLFIGARNGGTLGFNGTIDELKFSSGIVPEPSSAVLLFGGLSVVFLWAVCLCGRKLAGKA
jgi:hypothetical protein